MMDCFNSTKIDKLTFLYKKKDIPVSSRLEIDNKLKQYFPDYTCNHKYGQIFNRLTPTKLSSPERQNVINNLQMPSQDQLLNALTDITRDNSYITKQIKCTELHLAKDIILNNPVNDYISMLAEQYYGSEEAELIESNKNEYSLKLYPKRNINSDSNIKICIKFYNKSAEYRRRHKTHICKLTEPLSNADIEKAGSAYNPDKNTLDLSKVNLLRIEIEFHTTNKLMPVINTLSETEDRLSAHLLIESLKNESLYDNMEDVFTSTLKKYAFKTKDTADETGGEVNNIRKLACQLLSKSSDLYYYIALTEELGLKSKFSEIANLARKIAPKTDLHAELYNNLFESAEDKEATVHSEYFTSSCNSYSSKPLKHSMLIYSVPILDDS